VAAGTGLTNESMLTGEEKFVQKIVGSSVFGGTALDRGSLIVRVTKIQENATFNQLQRMVEDA
jgi:Cd2+/Zn2+-exporting ATPase